MLQVKNNATKRTNTTKRGYPAEKRFRKLLKRHFAYWLGLLVTTVLREIPLSFCSWALSRIFLIWYVFFVKYRRRTQKHLRMVFGKTRDDKWYKHTTRTMFMNLGRNLAEFLHIPRMPRSRFLELVDGSDYVKKISAATSKGRGAICVTGHIGNWELLAAYSAKFFPTAVIAKKIYFEKFDREVVKRRKALGVEVIYQEDGLMPVMRALRSNRVIGILADQDISDIAGVFVDFLGMEAYTPIGPASMAIASDAPLFVVCMERISEGRHRILISDQVPWTPSGSRKSDRFNLTENWNRLLCGFIKKHPEQWVWFHRRWKTTRDKIRARNGKI